MASGGALAEVRCLECGRIEGREHLQERLHALNPGWVRPNDVEMAPDGDAELPSEAIAAFVVADCEACDGPLKPNVVFFGEGVPRDRVERAYAAVEGAERLLVVGTSLAVFSGFRFVRRARERGIPVALVNLGESRGDPFADLLVQGLAGDVLPRTLERLRRAAGGG